MTVCFGPSLESIIFTLIVAILIPSLVIYFANKKLKPQNKSVFVLLSIIVFILLFFAISTLLLQFFTPPCGPGIRLIASNFTYFEENKTCLLNNQLIENEYFCEGLFNDFKDNLTMVQDGIYQGFVHQKIYY